MKLARLSSHSKRQLLARETVGMSASNYSNRGFVHSHPMNTPSASCNANSLMINLWVRRCDRKAANVRAFEVAPSTECLGVWQTTTTATRRCKLCFSKPEELFPAFSLQFLHRNPALKLKAVETNLSKGLLHWSRRCLHAPGIMSRESRVQGL